MDAKAITKALGGKWQGSYGLCHCPAHDDPAPSLKIHDDPKKSDGIDVHCFAGCDWKDIKDALRSQGLLDGSFVGAREPSPRSSEEPKKIDWSLWQKAVPLPGTLGEVYFTKH